MKHSILLFALCLCCSVWAQDNIGINTAAPDPSALVDMTSTSQGLLVPRMTAAQRTAIPSPAAGLLVYQTDSPPGISSAGFYFFTGYAWHKLGQTTLRLEDADMDTRVIVEETPDEDQVHFFLGGTRGLSIKADSAGQRSRLEFPTNNGAVGIGHGALAASSAVGLAVGDSALAMNTTGLGNIAVGAQALKRNTTGQFNLAFGAEALRDNLTGNFNTAFGSQALRANSSASNNVAIGYRSLLSNMTGAGNTAFGAMSLPLNTAGSENTAVGFRIMSLNTTAGQHVAAGTFALRMNTTGQRNTAVGFNAATSNMTGSDIVAVGHSALDASTGLSAVTAIGAGALGSATTGAGNTAFGFEALANATAGEFNTAFGYRALTGNTTGNRNTAFGHEGLLAATGNRNTAFGHGALRNNVAGNANTAIGFESGLANVSGSDNTLVGYRANLSADSLENVTVIGYNVTGAQDNTFILGGTASRIGIGTNNPVPGAKLELASTSRGLLLPNVGTLANVYQIPNVSSANGLMVFADNLRSHYMRHIPSVGGWLNLNNVFQGWMLEDSEEGMIPVSNGTAFVPGYPDALRDVDGDTRMEIERNPDEDIFRLRLAGNERLVVRENAGINQFLLIEPKGPYDCIFVGMHAGQQASTGENNTGIGYEALRNVTIGERNTAFGYKALRDNTTGNRNTAVGSGALMNNETGSNNVAIGRDALQALVSGNDNVGIGTAAGGAITSQSRNTVVGFLANISGNISNATAIGYRALVATENAMVIGEVNGVNGASRDAYVGMGTITPEALLHVVRLNGEFGGHLVIDEETDGFGRIKFRNNTTTEEWSMLGRRTPLAVDARFNFYYGQNILSIEGAGDATLTGSLTQNSDRRLKRDLFPIDFDWALLDHVNLVRYRWAGPGRSARPQLGVIAQVLANGFPELVHAQDDGYLTVNYLGLVPYVLEGAKAADADKENLFGQAKQIASDLEALRAEVEALRASSTPGQPTRSRQ